MFSLKQGLKRNMKVLLKELFDIVPTVTVEA